MLDLATRSATPSTTDGPARRRVSTGERWGILLVAIGRGDEASFEILAHEVHGLLVAHALRILNDINDADEVVQEVLIEVWRNAYRYDPDRARAMTWLGQIVRHRAIDLVRRSTSRRSREHRDALRSAPLDINHIDHTVERVLLHADQEVVRTALPRLSRLQQEAVALVYYDGLTSAQAATRLGIPISTVKTRVRDGIIKLRIHVTSTRPQPQ